MIIDDIGKEIIMIHNIQLTLFYLMIFILSYIIGSIPFGVIISKINHIDIMKEGSCSPGYTNVKRVLGLKWGILVFMLDFFKTIFSIIVSFMLFFSIFIKFPVTAELINEAIYYNNVSNIIAINRNIIIFLSGFGVIIGHNYPIFNHFKGGKGITCTLGTCLVFNIYWALGLFIIYFAIKKITHYVSLGSIIALCCLFISAFFMTMFKIYPFNFENARYVLPILLLISLINIYRHKENIKRLIKGTENKTK